MSNCKWLILVCALLAGLLVGCSGPATSQQGGSPTQALQQAPGTNSTKQPEHPAQLKSPTEAVHPSEVRQPNAAKTSASAAPVQPTASSAAPKPKMQNQSPNGAKAVTQVPVKQRAAVPEVATDHPQSTVSIQIVGDKQHSAILSAQSVPFKDGDTVLDIITRCLKGKSIQYEYSGALATAYVKGIDNLYEFDDGPRSGWMFKVNGRFGDKSAGGYPVKAGDSIVWLYTIDSGKDIGAR
jgi:hypothetical protein